MSASAAELVQRGDVQTNDHAADDASGSAVSEYTDADKSDESCCRHHCCSCPPTRHCSLVWLTSAASLIILVVIVFAAGIAFESANMDAARSTMNFYTLPQVCARTATTGAYGTFANRTAARSANATIQHCGPCGQVCGIIRHDEFLFESLHFCQKSHGRFFSVPRLLAPLPLQCSDDTDIDVYRATAQTLTATTTKCALKVFTSGRAGATECMAQTVGFTPACVPCWVENIVCDQSACLFTCLWSIVRGEKNNRDLSSAELSACLKCDEVLCGPAFITCAGANRRRLGITSDIGRSNAELCNASAAV